MKKQIIFMFVAIFSLVLVARPPVEVIKVYECENIELSQDVQLTQDLNLSLEHFDALELTLLTSTEVEISYGDILVKNYNDISISTNLNEVYNMAYESSYKTSNGIKENAEKMQLLKKGSVVDYSDIINSKSSTTLKSYCNTQGLMTIPGDTHNLKHSFQEVRIRGVDVYLT